MKKFIEYVNTNKRAKAAHIIIIICLWAFIIFFLLPRACVQQDSAERTAAKNARNDAIIHKYD